MWQIIDLVADWRRHVEALHIHVRTMQLIELLRWIGYNNTYWHIYNVVDLAIGRQKEVAPRLET